MYAVLDSVFKALVMEQALSVGPAVMTAEAAAGGDMPGLEIHATVVKEMVVQLHTAWRKQVCATSSQLESVSKLCVIFPGWAYMELQAISVFFFFFWEITVSMLCLGSSEALPSFYPNLCGVQMLVQLHAVWRKQVCAKCGIGV